MRSRKPTSLDWLVPGALLVTTAWVLWHGLVALPQRYDALQSRGVPVRVSLVECGSGKGGDSHGYGCLVRTDYRGSVRQWRVDRNVRAETGADGEAAGLVDPRHPGNSALVDDVARRTGTGGRAVLFAGLCLALSVLTGALTVRKRRRPVGFGRQPS
ncbi:MAG TPA: hypothetical protein VHO29_08140 [Marmoricola sp.]|nr:hypothetical protein [Marmoricola sp.]